jgi:hypothetical protein
VGDPVDPMGQNPARSPLQTFHTSGRRHIFPCADQTKPKCAERGRKVSPVLLRAASKNLNREGVKTASSEQGKPPPRFRTGSIVVHPEGIWYHSVTPSSERIIQDI